MNNTEDIYKIMGASNHALSKRAENDFYSTPKNAVIKLLEKLEEVDIQLPNLIIEPGVGDGAIANILKEKGHTITGFDIVDRGWPGTIIKDWLKVNERPEQEMAIIANFPYKDILEHTWHSISLLNDGEYLISLAKIQFLEGQKRKELFSYFPPKYVFVFSSRIKCLANGIDDGNSSAICFCWYVFQKGFNGMPMISWI